MFTRGFDVDGRDRACGRACRLAVACALLALAAQTPHAAPNVVPVTERETINIGYQNTSLPFSYLDARNQHVGYSVDLCAQVIADIERQRGRPFREVHPVPVSSKTRIPLLLAGKIDLECGSTTNTTERRHLGLAFSVTTFVSDVAVLVRGGPGAPQRVQDLQRSQEPGLPVVTTAGSTSARHLRDLEATLPVPLRVVHAVDHGESFRMLAEGRASAFVMDRVLLTARVAALANRAPGDFVLLEGTVSPHAVEHYALMMRDTDADLKQVVDKTLKRLMQGGEIERIYARWFQQPIAAPAAGTDAGMGLQPLTLDLPISDELKRLFRTPSDAPYATPAPPATMR
jgi:glutamate/aspartate transport system substrate-binding protein